MEKEKIIELLDSLKECLTKNENQIEWDNVTVEDIPSNLQNEIIENYFQNNSFYTIMDNVLNYSNISEILSYLSDRV